MRVRVFVLVALALVGCGSAWALGNTEEKAMKELEELDEAYGAALIRGDVEAWGPLHAEDVVKMPPDAPAATTRETTVAMMKALLETMEFVSFNVTLMQREVHGDIAFGWAVYTWEARLKGGGDPIFYDGKALAIYQRQPDGRWLITHDCFNSNVPPAGP
jgi:ketosteroid isomerase-like protein